MTKKESKEKRIEDILEAAVSEFMEKGYENASMESIATRAGLTKGGLYYHFESKDDILIRANERFMEPIMTLISAAMGRPIVADGLAEYINGFLKYWIDHPRELTFIFLSMTKTISTSKFKEAYNGYITQMTGFFHELYRKGVDLGEFVERDYGSTALVLMASLDSMAGYLCMDDSLSLDEVVVDFTNVFIEQYRRNTVS